MRPIGLAAAVGFAAIYAASLMHLSRASAFPMEEALAILVIVGVGFSFLAWVTTIGVRPQSLTITAPVGEAVVALVLVALLAFHLVGVKSWSDGLVPGAAAGGDDLAHEAWKLATKLLAFVVVPLFIFRILFNTTWAEFGLTAASWRRLLGRDGLGVIVIGVAVCAFQYAAGSAAAPFREGQYAAEALQLGLPLAFAWLVFEVGLVEEFFFRAVLQERLAALFRSDIAGLFVMAAIFGLVHAPGMVLRGAGVQEGLGANPDILTAAAYTIAVQAVAAFMFGILWLRTRNLLAVMLVHAAMDLLSNAPDLLRAFGFAQQSA
ncbi:MAG: lysostaphin resistance A-like protein [Micropepsaceae bacterium]